MASQKAHHGFSIYVGIEFVSTRLPDRAGTRPCQEFRQLASPKRSRNSFDHTLKPIQSLNDFAARLPLARKMLLPLSLRYMMREKIGDVFTMNKFISIVLLTAFLGVFPAAVLSQGIFEYGRAVGSVPHGQGITGGKVSGGAQQRGGTVGGIGDVGGRMPTRLVVSAKTTGLYPRQDEETEKLEQLS